MSKPSRNSRKVVIKLGGSLLTQSNLTERFERWFKKLQQDSPWEKFIMLVGGGAPVEGLRLVDQANPLDESLCHWLAVKQMNLNGKLVDSLLPDWVLTKKLITIETAEVSLKAIFVPHNFLLREEPNYPGRKLPIGWQTTSDAIATRLAVCIGAELILLKSTDPPKDIAANDWNSLAKKGYIDRVTPTLIEEVAIRRIEKLP